jgi:hypothetical protein
MELWNHGHMQTICANHTTSFLQQLICQFHLHSSDIILAVSWLAYKPSIQKILGSVLTTVTDDDYKMSVSWQPTIKNKSRVNSQNVVYINIRKEITSNLIFL